MLINKRARRIATMSLCSLFTSAGMVSQSVAEMTLLWGDTHVHSAYSADAYFLGNRSVTPDVAYRFARGEPVIHPYHRARIQIDRPLDFIVVADHAEMMGVFNEIYDSGLQLGKEYSWLDSAKGWLIERMVTRTIDSGDFTAIKERMSPALEDAVVAAAREPEIPALPNAATLQKKVWDHSIALADEYNSPGTFTTFIGWEWSSAPGAANLHRVVVSNADAKTAGTFQPFSSMDSPYPEDLWKFLEATEQKTGVNFIAIPHNANISHGFMFSENSLHGEKIDADYARQRMRWEPVAEITQMKGDSETHPIFSPDDQFADFETYLYTNDAANQAPFYTPKIGDYLRPALKRGLLIGEEIGVNPYQLGFIGSTDSHTGLSTTDEKNFGGKFAIDSTPESKDRPAGMEGEGVSGWSVSAQGLAAVWAENNDRDSILEAFKRREVYATTGPRIALQVFASWDYSEADISADTSSAALRSRGVPMGGELDAPTGSQIPGFIIKAMKDPNGANLDRLQMIKAWRDETGNAREKVYNIAFAGDRKLNEEGELAPIGNTVDLTTARYTNTIGSTSLSVFWQDPDFNASESAFYYVRVLEIPTPRHLLFDAIALGLDAPKEGASVIQERAYSSPIWYRDQRGAVPNGADNNDEN